ncbi:MAG: transcription elongation factor GreA [Lachnospiraceae bacterium]|nr:transcription elongation factor GreA [Lachnospiraceae bacterium]
MFDELTKEDIAKMEAEIEHRKLVVRKEALEDVKEARAQGDLSENFEYKAAKQFKNQNESRIRYLEKMIKTAKIIDSKVEDGVVGMNCAVDVYFVDDDITDTYTIVTTVRGNSLKNLISKESPLGSSIFGRKVGDKVNVKVNDSINYDVIIKAIRYDDSAKDLDLRKF